MRTILAVGLALLALAGPAVSFGAPFALHPGDILVADRGSFQNNNVARLLRVDPAGAITVLGSSANSLLKSPSSVYQDNDDALLIADITATADQGAILRLDLATGAITSVVSGTGLNGVTSFALDPGSDFITTDLLALGAPTPGAIYRVGRSGAPRVLIAHGTNLGSNPYRILREPSGTYLVLNQSDFQIRRLDVATGASPTWAIDVRLKNLRDMKRMPDGTVFTVGGDSPSRLSKIAPDGTVSVFADDGLLFQPSSLVALANGDLLVGNGDGSIVRVGGTTAAQSYFLPPGSVFDPRGMTLVETTAVPATVSTWGAIKAAYR